MVWYLAKLILLLPLLAVLIWGCLRLTRSMQNRLAGNGAQGRSIRLVETTFLGPGIRLAVIDYRGREILLGCTRHGLTRLCEVPPAGPNAGEGSV